ncbi:MAG: hypothetical protein JO159_15935 [Acidobacteria bacterium]|nr:hypothetical protein [Acidobacteriota bacterium]
MRRALKRCLPILAALLSGEMLQGQSGRLDFPATLHAGAAFSLPTSGSGKAELYIVGPGQVLRRTVNLGEAASFAAGELQNAGHYVALLVAADSTRSAQFDVLPESEPATLSFLARPSRLPVSQGGGISGVVYVFDRYRNLILEPLSVSFELSGGGAAQKQVASTRDGVAWVRMNSSPQAGIAQFQASAGRVSERRVVQQFAGDPCALRMSARAAGAKIVLETAPVRDCNGNPVPDGTVVTFTEAYEGRESTVDVPIKRDIAHTEMPAHSGALITVASGVVMGNEIRWGGGK